MTSSLGPRQWSLLESDSLLNWAPDETFHSLLTRYHLLSGGVSRRRTLFRVFGDSSWGARHDFPVQLQAFVDHMNGQLGSADDIICERTILPLFLPFVSEEHAQSAIRSMSYKGHGTVSAKLGLLRSDFSKGHPLRACPNCLVADMERYGFTYWHRIHQVPGIAVCPLHRRLLLIAHDQDLTLREWYLPAAARLVHPPGEESLSELELGRLTKLASFVEGLLSSAKDLRLDLSALRRVLHARLRSTSLATVAGVVRLDSLVGTYFQHWGSLLRILGSGVSPQPRSFTRTLGKMLDRSPAGAHPLLWLTLAAMLFDSWSDLMKHYHLEALDTSRHSGGDPTSYTAAPDPRVSELRRLIVSGKSVWAATRELGMSSSVARRLCVIHGIAQSRVLANVGGDVSERILELYERGRSQNDIATELIINVTLVRFTLDSSPGVALRRKSFSAAALKEEHRKTLLSMRLSYPDLPRAKLRLKCQAAYSWLLNNDRAWLDSSLPLPRSVRSEVRHPAQHSLF